MYYRASNKHGTGVFSDVATIVASTVPDQLAPATTTNDGADVDATWPLTPSERGAAVTAYRIKWKAQNGSYYEIATCDGTDATVVANRACSVAMATLTGAFSLPLGAPIYAIVEAYNAKGYSTPSADGGGALAQTAPTEGPAAQRGGDTSDSLIEVTWDPLAAQYNGGAAVIEYELWWDSGSGGALTKLVDCLPPRVRHITGIQAGYTYRYALAAKNVHGVGPLGTTLSVVAAGLPGFPTDFTAGAITTTSLTFSWSPPTDTGGVPVDDYEVSRETSAGSGIWTSLGTTGGAASYTATGLAEATTYSFTAAAVTAAGAGPTAPGPFTMTTASSGGGGGGGGNLTI